MEECFVLMWYQQTNTALVKYINLGEMDISDLWN